MDKREAAQLFGYGSWANAVVFDVVGAVPEEQRQAAATGSFPSLVGTLAHIVSAEWVWLQRWLGESPTAVPSWAATPSLAALRAELSAVESGRASFLDALADSDLERAVSYRTLAGQAYTDTLAALFRHVINHSTYHRGQLTAQLRQLGHTPPNTDLVRYLRESR